MPSKSIFVVAQFIAPLKTGVMNHAPTIVAFLLRPLRNPSITKKLLLNQYIVEQTPSLRYSRGRLFYKIFAGVSAWHKAEKITKGGMRCAFPPLWL
jgi:hypothetical protein